MDAARSSTKILTLFSLFTLFITLSSCYAEQSSAYGFDGAEVYEHLTNKGFFEICNRSFLKADFHKLYSNFDAFIECMADDQSLADIIAQSEIDFLADATNKDRYCSAPPSYRDPRKHLQKRFNKIYFQFIKEYYEGLLEKYATSLLTNAHIRDFLHGMNELDTLAKQIFTSVLESLEPTLPGISARMYGGHQELTIISKIVRYKKTDGWGTTPHCDKSALSIIWDSSDDNNDSLLLCEDVKQPTLKSLKRPHRCYTRQEDATSVLLIPGAACLKAHIDLAPTVHGVAPINKEYRHAVISFLLIPNLDMSDIKTDFIEADIVATP